MEKLKFINNRHETEWGYQLPDGRIIDLVDEDGKLALRYDRAFNLGTGEICPCDTHPEESTTLNDPTKQGGRTVHCYDEVYMNFSTRFRIDGRKLKHIKRFFLKKGFNVTTEAILHQYCA